MNQIITCDECGLRFRGKDGSACPNCQSWQQVPNAKSKPADRPVPSSVDPLDGLKPENRVLVDAQNRTTAAVRSLAVFFFYNLFWGAIVGLLVLIASALPPVRDCDFYDGCTNATNPASIFLLVLAAIAAIAGIWITMASAIKELRASRTTQTFM